MKAQLFPPIGAAPHAMTDVQFYASCALIGFMSRQEPLPDDKEIAAWCFSIGRHMALEASKPVG
jgi:hypothetical protein